MKNQASSINHLWIIYDSSWFYLIPFKYLCWLLVQVVCFSHFFQKWCKNAKRGCIAQLSPPLLGWSLLPFLAISVCIESNDHNPKRERERKNVSVPRIFMYLQFPSKKDGWKMIHSIFCKSPIFRWKMLVLGRLLCFFQNYAYKNRRLLLLRLLQAYFLWAKKYRFQCPAPSFPKLPNFPLDTHSADWHPWPSSHICACRPKKKKNASGSRAFLRTQKKTVVKVDGATPNRWLSKGPW